MKPIRRMVLSIFVLLLFGAFGANSLAENGSTKTTNPHVILIYVDDMRWDSMSIEGHPFLQTPNIDRLATEGMLFSRGYVVVPLCGPNRACLNTGLLPSHHGITNHVVHGFADSLYPEGRFLPGTIQETGAFTSTIGKYFHKPHDFARPEYDRWFVHNGQNGPDLQHISRNYNVDGVQAQNSIAKMISQSPTGYATDIDFSETIRILTERSSEKTFSFVSPFAPHSPYTPAPRHEGVFAAMPRPEPPNFNVPEEWVDFNPVASDRLLAAIDFDNMVVTPLGGTSTVVHGINAGYESTDLEFVPNQWDGEQDDGELGVSGSHFVANRMLVDVNDLDLGIAIGDHAKGDGYVMYCERSVHQRFREMTRVGSANHLISVRHNGSSWQYNNDTPGHTVSTLEFLREIYNSQAEMILAIDEGVGRLLQQLETLGILEDSVIIFSSDNGIHFGEHRIHQNKKKLPFEESCRVPLLVRYGSNVQGQGPVDGDQLVSHADLMLTMVELLGGNIPIPARGTRYYGRSLAGEWMGTNGTADVNRRDDLICIRYPDTNPRDNLDNDGMVWASIVSDDGWKYVDVNLNIGSDVNDFLHGLYRDGVKPMLFDLNNDPYELNDLVDRAEWYQKRKELSERLQSQLREYDVDFEFEPFSNVVEVDEVVVNTGMLLKGNTISLQESDDEYLEYAPVKQNQIELEFEGVTYTKNPSSIQLKMESASDTNGIRRIVSAFNYYQNEFEVIDDRQITYRDHVHDLNLTPGTHYISSDREFRVKIRFQKPLSRSLRPWKIRIDQLIWTVNRRF